MTPPGAKLFHMATLILTFIIAMTIHDVTARVVTPAPTGTPNDELQQKRKLEPGYVPDTEKPAILVPNKDASSGEDSGGERKKKNKNNDVGARSYEPESDFVLVRNHSDLPECNLWATDPEIYAKISSLVKEGAKLLEYNLDFPEYDVNPLLVNMSTNFMTTRWARAYTKHGKTLLSLSFNYAVLSLTMLSFGVEKINVDIVDAPKGCFGHFTPDQKLKKIMEVVMSDFRMAYEERQWVGAFDYACHQIIEADKNKVAHFKYQCCERVEEGGRIECLKDISVKWINLMFFLVATLKIAAFLLGPLFLQDWAYSESLKQSDYLVKLKDPMQKSILVKKLKVPGDNSGGSAKENMREFSKFRTIVKNIAPEKINYVTFRKLQIQVDHRRLMTEKSVPVGLFSFLYKNIIWCGIRHWEPFLSCCRESIFGSCSPKFLWIKLRKRSDCNNSCKKFCSWEHVFNILGGLLLLLCIPIPYYIRVAIYYAYEEMDVAARKEAIKELDLDYPWEHTLIHYIDPSHALMFLLYITYGISFVLLAAFRSCNAGKFDPIAVGAIEDMRNVNRMECFRLVLAHVILPFEKFGVCGVLVAAAYWPLVLPICALVCICYCTPTLYLLGRFLIHNRPSFLRNAPIPTSPTHYSPKNEDRHTLSKGTTSFETCLLLENISPENKAATGESFFSCKINRNACYTAFLSVIVGLLCSVFMLSVLLLFADVLGFIVEVFVFTLMGAIINASSAAKYLMLAFWIMVYSSSCFNNCYNKYMDLNDHIFKFIKTKLKEDIKEVTMLREDMQKNTAFKYFNKKDFQELRDMEIEEELDSDFETENARKDLLGKYHGYDSSWDSIEYIDDKLHWRVHNLLLFVDSHDVPRIPKTLFHKICELDAPGCPGPFHQSLLEAFKQLGYMVIFIVFVLITVMAFGDAYKLSSTNQLMVTLAGGFMPFVVRFVMKPKAATIDLNSYSFEGKIHQIIYKFNETWPVFDLSFKVDRTVDPCTPDPRAETHPSGDNGGDEHGHHHDMADGQLPPPAAFIGPQPYIQEPSCSGREHVMSGGCGGNEPTHVDLLITIRDDTDEDDNVHHQEPPAVTGSQSQPLQPQQGGGVSSGGGGMGDSSTNGVVITDQPHSNSTATSGPHSQPVQAPLASREESPGASPSVSMRGNINNPTNATMPNHKDRRFQGLSYYDRFISSPDEGDNSGPGSNTTFGSPSPNYDRYGYPIRHSMETQTGGGMEQPFIRSWHRPAYTSTSTQVLTPPGGVGGSGGGGGRPVDLMVDLNRGGIRVRNQTSLDKEKESGFGENGIGMQARGSPYKQLPSQPSKDESSV